MGYEIDFLAVGKESKGGDAISLRWGELNSTDQFIVVIDGGFTDSGEKLVESINEYYGKPDTIDLVVSTHPDADHINGLSHVLDAFKVKKLWLHLPWEHNDDIASKFKDGRVTDDSISKRLKEACEAAWELYQKAIDNKIPVEEPFSCKNMTISYRGGQLKILGPSKEYYEELLPEFDGLPETVDSSRSAFTHTFQRAVNWVKEIWDKDFLDDKGETSAKNNSSVILELSYDSKRFVFTADAGIPALEQAVNKAGPPDQLRLIQIPHHGSKRNIGPTVLNRLVGNIASKNGSKSISAIVSCPKENPDNKHPNKRVLNAFTRRGCTCYTTGKASFCYPSLGRDGWIKAVPCDFYDEVEDDS